MTREVNLNPACRRQQLFLEVRRATQRQMPILGLKFCHGIFRAVESWWRYLFPPACWPAGPSSIKVELSREWVPPAAASIEAVTPDPGPAQPYLAGAPPRPTETLASRGPLRSPFPNRNGKQQWTESGAGTIQCPVSAFRTSDDRRQCFSRSISFSVCCGPPSKMLCRDTHIVTSSSRSSAAAHTDKQCPKLCTMFGFATSHR